MARGEVGEATPNGNAGMSHGMGRLLLFGALILTGALAACTPARSRSAGPSSVEMSAAGTPITAETANGPTAATIASYLAPDENDSNACPLVTMADLKQAFGTALSGLVVAPGVGGVQVESSPRSAQRCNIFVGIGTPGSSAVATIYYELLSPGEHGNISSSDAGSYVKLLATGDTVALSTDPQAVSRTQAQTLFAVLLHRLAQPANPALFLAPSS